MTRLSTSALFAMSLLMAALACAHREPAVSEGAPLSTGVAADSAYRCTQVMGVSVTGDWFNAGFERGLNGDRWQVLWRKKAFVDVWADPNDEIWKVPVQSACAEGAHDPDRVIFTGVHWEFTTEEQWRAALSKVVETLRGKYPSLKRIELLTMLRTPGNQGCGSFMTVVEPRVDAAVAAVAAGSGGFVTAAPRVETPTCDVFTKGGPHFTDAAAMARVADLYRLALAGRTPPLAPGDNS